MLYTCRICIFLLIVFISPFVLAQENIQFIQYYTNLYQINPSYAGLDGQAHLSVGYRKQWLGFEGAPSNALVTYHAPLRLHWSIGGQAFTDTQGPINVSGMLGTFGYNIMLGEHKTLNFAVSAGFSSVSLNFGDESLTSLIPDPALADLSGMALLGNAGMNFRFKNKLIGISLPGLFSTNQPFPKTVNIGSPALAGGVMFHASDRFYFKRDRNAIEPHIAYRYYLNMPGQFEVGGLVHLDHKMWGGLAYRQGLGLAVMAGYKYDRKYMFSYSYGIRNFAEGSIPYDSHEIQLDVLLGRKQRGREYLSFVDSQKPKKVKRTKAQHEMLAKRIDKIEEDHSAIAGKKSVSVTDTIRIVVTDTVTVRVVIKEDGSHEVHKPRMELHLNDNKTAEELARDSVELELAYSRMIAEELQKRLEASNNDKKSLDDKIHENIISDPAWQEYIMEPGLYVVKKDFAKFQEAITYSEDLFNKGFFTHYGYDRKTRKWYVYALKTNNKAEAESEKKVWSRKAQFKDVYIHEVKK